jgi:hypothetical protein
MADTVRPFDSGGWFPVHNAIFDVVMPSLSPNAWKILCVAIRQTLGWVADPDGDPQQRKEWDRISYSQFQEKAGLVSKATTQRALEECLEAGYLIRRQEGTYRGKPAFAYALNRDYEVELPSTTPVSGAVTTPVSGAVTTPVSGAVTTPVSGVTKQRETNQNDGVVVSDGFVLRSLAEMGILEPTRSELAGYPWVTREYIASWRLWHGVHPEAGAGMLVRNIRERVEAPAVDIAELEAAQDPDGLPGVADRLSEERRKRYAGGAFAGSIVS